MKLLFRADASLIIGTGHVMRCLTLANEGKKRWSSCFVLRKPGKALAEFIVSLGHEVVELVTSYEPQEPNSNSLTHNNWLPVSQVQDAKETVGVIAEFKPDWIVVDHYALDATWSLITKKYVAKIFVIDDLGDRDLVCDLLLDQNLGASIAKYESKVHRNCEFLLGPTFALLRNEFREWREHSLTRRLDSGIKHILITMGGVDEENYTLRILKEITKSEYAALCVFTVVIGGAYPHSNLLNEFVETSGLTVSVLSNVNNMAEIMSNSDLCIGAAGSTSWERCCLGLPTITIAIANNQINIAEQLSKRNVAIYSNVSNLLRNFEQFFDLSGTEILRALSMNSCQTCDGLGTLRVVEELEKKFEN